MSGLIGGVDRLATVVARSHCLACGVASVVDWPKVLTPAPPQPDRVYQIIKSLQQAMDFEGSAVTPPPLRSAAKTAMLPSTSLTWSWRQVPAHDFRLPNVNLISGRIMVQAAPASVHRRCVVAVSYPFAVFENAGLKTMRFHDLRHTAATLLMAEGIP